MAIGALHAPHLSRTRISPFHRFLAGCTLSTSLRSAPPPSTAICRATGALHALHLIRTRFSPSHRYQSSSRCGARPLPLSDMHIPLQPLESGYKYVSCSHPLKCASLFSTTNSPATGALPTIFLSLTFICFFQPLEIRLQVHCELSNSLTRVSLFHCWLFGYWCVSRSLPLSGAFLCFPLLANRLQVYCPHCLSATQ